MESVVKNMVHVEKVNAVPNMDGVERPMTIVVKDVNPNLENVNQPVPPLVLHQQNLMLHPKLHIVENVVKNMVRVEKVNVVPNMDGVERPMTIVVKDVNLNLVFAIIIIIITKILTLIFPTLISIFHS